MSMMMPVMAVMAVMLLAKGKKKGKEVQTPEESVYMKHLGETPLLMRAGTTLYIKQESS